jgi:hypothetical protein
MSTARSFCKNQGGDLVLPRNIKEHRYIWDVAKTNNLDRPWIGLRKEQQTNTFYTLDGKNTSYKNWGTSQPNTDASFGDEKCVAFWEEPYGKWHDVSCNDEYSYVCRMTCKSTILFIKLFTFNNS